MGKTIMVVEDDNHFQKLYATMLEDTDYEIIPAYDGDEALEKLDEIKPDLIILDMLLDTITGDTFFLYLKSMPECSDIPIIVASNSSKRDYKNLLTIDPDLVFLNKNFTSERLISEIMVKIG